MEEKTINIHELQLVANQIESIQKKYEAIDQATGNNYNIFQVLGIQSREAGVIFELRVMRNKLSLWTSAWLMKPREETYGKYDDLITAIKAVGRYEQPLVSTDPIEELAAEMKKGIEACQKYYDDYLKK